MWERFDDEFLQIFLIFGCFGAPILETFGTHRCKKKRSEKSNENDSKNCSGENPTSRLWAPKREQQNMGNQTGGPNTPWRALRHGGGYKLPIYGPEAAASKNYWKGLAASAAAAKRRGARDD